MLSKEEKLKYGEALRLQMKEKQERKRNDDLAKRAVNKVVNHHSDRTIVPDPAVLDQKQLLRNKLEAQDYNPFGKAGSGAPNRKQQNNSGGNFEQNQSHLMGLPSQEELPGRSYPPETYNEHPPSYQNIEPRNGPDRRQYMPQNQGSYPGGQDSLGPHSGGKYPQRETRQPQYYEQEQYMDSRPVNQQRQYQKDPRQYPQQAASYQQTRDYQEPPPRQQYAERPQQHRQPQYHDPPAGSGNSGLYRQDYSQPHLNNERQYQQPPQQTKTRVKTIQNDEVQEIYKKGGRNILKLQNQTMNEHLVKQKQKQEMQAFLKQQMEEAQKRKQEEREKLKREEMEQQRRNKEYIERQNMRMQEEERKKVEEKQKLVEENLRNLEKKKEMEQQAKNKVQRVQRQQMQRKIREQMQVQKTKQRQRQRSDDNERINKARKDSSSSVSDTSSSNTYSKGFNTNVSRQFLKKEREKDGQRGRNDKKLEMFTAQIQKMRDQIVNQGDTFQQQINKIKREAQRAQDEKRKADLEVQRLRLELQKKNKETQLRLLQALKRNDPYGQQFYQPPPQPRPEPRRQRNYHPPPPHEQSYNDLDAENDFMDLDQKPYGIPSRLPPNPKKPMSKKGNRVYEHPTQQPQRRQLPKSAKNDYTWQKQFRPEESIIGTLNAESKKIPINIQSGTKLSMSGVEQLGKDAFMFGRSDPPPRRFQEQSKISRGSRRADKDQLDRLVQDRHENKWQMSTVKDDITKEIEDLLKKKDSHGNLQPSTVGRAGRQVLSRGALPYDGPALGTLNSNKGSLVSDGGTLDVDRIHGRNEARLRQLKALGVETVNTTNDDDLNRLNAILKNYN